MSTPAGYVIANVSVTNPEQMAEYRVWSTKAVAEFGGEFLVRGGAVSVLEGDWTPERVVMIRFPSVERAKHFYASQTYATARSVREGAGIMRMVLVEGVS